MFRIHVSRQCFSLSSAFASPWISISNWGWRYAVHMYTIGPYCHSYGKTTFDRGFVLRMAAPSLCSLLDVGQLRCKNGKKKRKKRINSSKTSQDLPLPYLALCPAYAPMARECDIKKWHRKKTPCQNAYTNEMSVKVGKVWQSMAK